MSDIIIIVLPLIAVGISMVLLINSVKKKRKKDEQSINEDYMSLGMCFGVAIGSIFTNTVGPNSISYGICFGMLGGMTIKKK